MIKHLIFDFDGVIVDSEILAAKALTKALSEIKVNYSTEFIAEHYAGNKVIKVVEDLSKIHNLGNKEIFFKKVMKLVNKFFAEELKSVEKPVIF